MDNICDKDINEISDVNLDKVNKSNLYEIMKLKIKDVKESINPETRENEFSITISEEQIFKKTTLIRENEVIRIIKVLDLDDFKPRKDKKGKDCDFPFIKDLIAINVSAEEYKKNQTGLITVIYEKKFGMKNIKNEVLFKRLLASTSNIRNKKIIYIREELFDKVNEILLCGMPKDMEHKQFSKYSAYYALASTDSTPVTMPNIVVVDDFKNEITGTCDLVKERITKGNAILHKRTGKALVDKKTGKIKREPDIIEYSVDNDEEYTVTENKPFDGAGLVDVNTATKWSYELGLNYLPSAFQFRAIPGIKGNLYVFNFSKFADEFKEDISKDESDKIIIKDAWSTGRLLYNEDGSLAINVILTKSQYKFFDHLNFDDWKKEFETERYGYQRTFNISKVSDKFEDIQDEVLLSYQPLQSLNLGLDEIKSLCTDTIKKIEAISNDVKEFLKYRGLLDYKENDKGEKKPKRTIPPYYKALKQNPEQLFTNKYIQEKVRKDIKNFKENTYKGAVLISGNYQTLMPDIFALAQWAFGIKPTGLLKDDEVYSNYWLKKEYSPLFCTGQIKRNFYDKLIGDQRNAILEYIYSKIFSDDKYVELKTDWNEEQLIEAMNDRVLTEKYFCNALSETTIKKLIEENEQIKDIYKNENGEKNNVKKLNRLLLEALYPDDIEKFTKNKIDIIRFPHIANEHSIGKVVDVDEQYRDYYKYATEGIITSIDAFIPLKANSADFDGDHILTNCSDVLIQAYKNQKSNTIIYVPEKRDNTTQPVTYKINDMAKAIDTDIKGMSNSIGRVVNQITKLWSLPQDEETSDYIKVMSIIGSLTIDFVKTGEKAAIPKNINEFLNKTKKPDFMRIIYPKQANNEKDINRNNRINKKPEIRSFDNTDCTMNRLYNYMKEELGKIEFKRDNNDFDFTMLMKNPNPNLAGNKTYPLIVKTLLELKKEYGDITKENSMENDKDEYNDEAKQDHEFKFRIFNTYARRILLALCTPQNQMTVDKLLDYLVFAHYCDKTFAKKDDENILWNCFGGEINKRLKLGVNAEFKEVDHATNSKALKTVKKKFIHSFKSEAKKVSIPILKPNENEALKEVEIFESEINYIKSATKTPEERRMAFILILLDKFCRAYGTTFEIYSRKKNRIVRSHILQLSNVHNKDYESTMRQLIEHGIIQTEQIRNTPTISCKIVPSIAQKGNSIKLTDLNQCRKYLKKLN